MVAISVFVLAAMLFSLQVQSAPVETDSTASASSAMHLLVKGSEDTTNYHLTRFVDDIEDIDKEVSLELDTVLPYINFLFDTLFNRPVQDDECVDDMTIQLVPEKDISTSDADISTAPDTKDVEPDSDSTDDNVAPA